MKKLMSKDEGFTLVELMVVVAIIGILSAVAIPNFKKYQAKSKTSEAKLQMSAAYTALQSWYSDYDNYSTCLNLMGFDPALEISSRYYAVGWVSGIAVGGANAQAVANGAPAACNAAASVVNDTSTATSSATNTSGYGAGRIVAGATLMVGANLTTANVPNIAAPTATTFRIGALGVIDSQKTSATAADAWTLNQNKRLVQERTGY